MMIWLFIPIAGLLHRLRGSYLAEHWLGFGLGLARLLIWALPLAVMAWVLGYGWLTSLCLLPAFFIGSVYGQPGHLNMGRTRDSGETQIDRDEWSDDFSAATMRGCVWSAYPALVLGSFGHVTAAWAMLTAGHLCGVAYELGWRTPSVAPEFRRGPEWGEVYYGAVIGAALILGAYLPAWI